MKKYQIIYADPPWELSYLKETKKGIDSYELPYKTMSIDDIAELPINQIADRNCLLFLWMTDNKLPNLQRIMMSWGFQYITVGFVWNKVAKTTSGVNATLGKYTRKSCEFCYIGRRGRVSVNSSRVDQYLGVPKGKHSEKPPEIRERIVGLCGDLPRIELFAREKTEGWDVWGNEVESDIQLTT